jgi:hypothetical protein
MSLCMVTSALCEVAARSTSSAGSSKSSAGQATKAKTTKSGYWVEAAMISV